MTTSLVDERVVWRETIVQTPAEFQEIAQSAEALFSRLGPAASPFGAPAWVEAWWRSRSPAVTVKVYAAWRGDEMVAALPFVWQRGRYVGMPVIRVASTSAGWGWFAGLVDPAGATEVAQRVGAWLLSRYSGRWSVLALGPWVDNDPFGAALAEVLEARGLICRRIAGATPRLPLAPSWEEFLAGRSRNFRRTIKRKEQPASEAGLVIHRTVAPEPAQLDEILTGVGEYSWQGKAGIAVVSRNEGRAFYRALAAAPGPLSLDLTWACNAEGRPIAYLFGVAQGGILHAIDTGFDAATTDLSPGLLVHFRTLRGAIERGFTAVDFGADHGYKERFDPQSIPTFELLVFRSRTLAAWGAAVQWARNIWKRRRTDLAENKSAQATDNGQVTDN